jgi:D-cysteine desulfhydrase
MEVSTMDFLPRRLRLARLPTPIVEVPALSRRTGGRVFVKRDDLTENAASGNKIRKLEFLLAEAKAQKAKVVITCGGLQSNHCRATAVACRQLGLSPHLVLRGEAPAAPEGNYFLDRLLGAEITFITGQQYSGERDAILDGLAFDCGRKGKKAYVVPEGGSNALGCLGYVVCAQEIRKFSDSKKVKFARIYHAAGSGGTSAGLGIGNALFGLGAEVVGVLVGGKAAPFEAHVRGVMGEAVHRFEIPGVGPGAELPVSFAEGYVGEGYAKVSRELARLIVEVARESGMIFDPVYTGKALQGMLGEEAKRGGGADVLFLHTGGLYGLLGQIGDVAGEL